MGTNHGGDPLGAILDIRGDPNDQNFEPRRVGTNHGGDPLGAILDIWGPLLTKISTLVGWGLITVGNARGHFGQKGGPL